MFHRVDTLLTDPSGLFAMGKKSLREILFFARERRRLAAVGIGIKAILASTNACDGIAAFINGQRDGDARFTAV